MLIIVVYSHVSVNCMLPFQSVDQNFNSYIFIWDMEDSHALYHNLSHVGKRHNEDKSVRTLYILA